MCVCVCVCVTGECCSHDDQVTRKFDNKEGGMTMGLYDILQLIKFLQVSSV